MQSIFNRRSIRKYTGEAVPEEMIEQILRAGMAAPSAHNKQPWHFIVIDNKDTLLEIPKFHPYSNMLKEASHAIVVCGDSTIEESEGYWVQDCSAATENMLLMAQELGLGACWLGVYPMEERIRGVKKLLGISEEVTPMAIIAIGYPAEKKGPVDRFNPSRVHRNKW